MKRLVSSFLVFVTLSTIPVPQAHAQSANEEPTSPNGLAPEGTRNPDGTPASSTFPGSGSRETYRRDNTTENTKKPSGTGFTLFLGLEAGMANSSPTDAVLESAKKGYQVGGKALGSVFTNAMALDLGLGYLYNRMAGSKDTSKDRETGVVNSLSNVSITTRAVYAEFSPRVRLGKNWQFGPVGQVFFGTDTTFGAEDAGKRSSVLGGLQFNFVAGTNVQFRTGLQFLTDINIYERQLYFGLLNVQIGIPIIKQKTIVRRIEEGSVEETERIKKIQKGVNRTVVKEVVKFLFDSEFINFETSSSRLSQQSDAFLRELAQFLMANREIWSAIKVDGHTDKRGNAEYNLNLSRDRAASVRNALINGGVSSAKVRSEGFGFNRPIEQGDDTVSLAKNRRVEMSFDGVRDPDRLGEGIKRLRDKYKK